MTPRRSADARGRAVVGLYGDPDTTWGIGVEAGLARDLVVADVEAGLRGLAAQYPHLGPPEQSVVSVPTDSWSEHRAWMLGAPYRPGEPLVRAAVSPVDDTGRTRLLVAAHHGACDGLGLLSLVAAGAGTPVTPTAPGVGDRAPRASFLASTPRRLAEAVRRPPPRIPALFAAGGDGEEVVLRTVPRTRIGTVAVCLALAQLYDGRRRATASSSVRSAARSAAEHPLLVVGASRRPPGTVAPDRRTAYLRFRVDPRWTLAEAVAAFASVAPEPDFPETSWGGVGPHLVRPFRGRLGSTAVVSNLGPLEGEVDWLAMYPAVSGPAAVSVGLVTTPSSTTLSLRTRSREFGTEDAEAMLDSLVEHLSSLREQDPPPA